MFLNLCECGLQLGSSAGVTVVLDCGGADADVDRELLKHLTIISPNESELANLTGVGIPRTYTYALPVSLVIEPVFCSLPWLMGSVDL